MRPGRGEFEPAITPILPDQLYSMAGAIETLLLAVPAEVHGHAIGVGAVKIEGRGMVSDQIKSEHPALIEAIARANAEFLRKARSNMTPESSRGAIDTLVLHRHVLQRLEDRAIEAQSQGVMARGVEKRLEQAGPPSACTHRCPRPAGAELRRWYCPVGKLRPKAAVTEGAPVRLFSSLNRYSSSVGKISEAGGAGLDHPRRGRM